MSKKTTCSFQINEYTVFDFTYIDSVQRVAMALMQSGYYANIMINDNGTYKLSIYNQCSPSQSKQTKREERNKVRGILI